MEILLPFLFMGVCGTIISLIAKSRGRSPVGWFFVGAIAPCIGLILVLVLPDLKVQQERERRLAMENRRLKEQLRKDRVVADQRHGEIQQRLGAHDTALGIDTGRATRSLPGAAPRVRVGADAERPPAAPDARQWWYVKGGARQGPVELAQLRSMWSAGTIDGTTKVWATGMAQWEAIDALPELGGALDA